MWNLFTRTATSLSSMVRESCPQCEIQHFLLQSNLHKILQFLFFSGKNNVSVFNCDWPQPQLGYLSLHQLETTVVLKWTPNSLMDASNPGTGVSGLNGVNTVVRKNSPGSSGNSVSWQQAISINMASLLYIHCHEVQLAVISAGLLDFLTIILHKEALISFS